MITALVAVQREERLIGWGSRGYIHQSNLRGKKTYSLIFNLSLLTKNLTKQKSRLQPWVSGENGTTPVTLDLLTDDCITSAEESTENDPKRVLG